MKPPAERVRTQRLLAALAAVILLILPAAALAPEASQSAGPDLLVKEFRMTELQARIAAMPLGTERDYFSGVVANRTGHVSDSIRLLTGVLPGIRASMERTAIALQALADDYAETFRYAGAAESDQELLAHYAGQFTKPELAGIRDDLSVMRLLGNAPPQTIEWHGPVDLKTTRNLLSSLNTRLTVNGVREEWLLDSGANLSVVSRSLARRLKLKPLPGFGQTMAGISGIENRLQVALLPDLPIGGATLHNVVVLILDDANLDLSYRDTNYQIEGIVGYPVFRALGAVAFLHDSRFVAGPAARIDGATTPIYMKLFTPVIECGFQGAELPFTFDTGASATSLSVRYYNRFAGEKKRWRIGRSTISEAGGVVERSIYLEPRLALKIGDQAVTLNNVPIYPTSMGSDIDDLYGNLGQDLVEQATGFSLDFTKMVFTLGPPFEKQRRR